MRLRQIALVARELEPAVEELCAVLRLRVAYRDPGVAVFGLENAVMPVGDGFLEVVSPVEPDAAATRYLDRHGGDGGYMVMLQTDDLAGDRAHLAGLGVREVWRAALPDIESVHLHPKDVGGTLLSLDQPQPPDSWRWAGPQWREARAPGGASALRAAELAARDPEALARRWGQILRLPVARAGAERHVVELEGSALRFVPSAAGGGERLVGFDVVCPDRARALETARGRGLPVGPDHVEIAGTRIQLV